MMERRRRIEIVKEDDVAIATCIDGSGPALVVLPSYGRDGFDDFDRFTDLIISKGWTVLRPQPRGIAGSTGPMTGLDLPTLAEDVACVIRAKKVGRAVVLGHAFGSFLARVLATTHPELVSGVILAAASATKVDPAVNATPFIAGNPSLPEEQRLAALRKAFFAPGHDPRPWLAGWYPETLAMQHSAVKATDLKPYWTSGNAPLLEINAHFDPFKPPQLWHELHDKVGDRVITIAIEDAAHALFPEQPERVADAVARWIDRL